MSIYIPTKLEALLWFQGTMTKEGKTEIKLANVTVALKVYLVVRRELHCRHTVDVFFDFVEKVIPAADQTAFVLIVNQVQFIRVPHFSYL